MKIRITLLLSIFAGTSFIQAAPLATTSMNNSVFAVSNSDLLQTSASIDFGQTSTLSNFQFDGQTGVSEFTDGTFGLAGDGTVNGGTSGTAGNGSQIAYNFNLLASPLGYNISQINTYAGWSIGRYAQAYEIFYTLVGDSTVFSLATINYSPAYTADPTSTEVSWSSDSGPFLLTGVSSIIFRFADTTTVYGTNYSGYRELDVIGQAIPEPSPTAALLGGVALLIGLSRFRRTAARG